MTDSKVNFAAYAVHANELTHKVSLQTQKIICCGTSFGMVQHIAHKLREIQYSVLVW